MSLDITPPHLAIVRQILMAFAPKDATVWAFGSRARGNARATSDLDLAIDAGRPLTLSETAALSAAFEEAPLPYRVDLVDLQSISAEFKAIIERDKTPLAEAQ